MAKKVNTTSSWHLLTFNQDYADEHDVPALAVMTDEKYKEWASTRLKFRANLGNRGDNFMEDEQGMTGKQLVDGGVVSRFAVNEEFAKMFNKAGLEYLSLCDIFDGDEYDEDDEDRDGTNDEDEDDGYESEEDD